jgi:SAM-dependent methyltransferase
MADHHHHHHSDEEGHSHVHHAHGHGHGHDFASSNRQFFDDLASEYDERPLVKELCGSISQAFLKEYAFDKEKTRVLDFACGTGEFATLPLLHLSASLNAFHPATQA